MSGPTQDIHFTEGQGRCNICPNTYFRNAEAAKKHVMGYQHQRELGNHNDLRIMGPSFIDRMLSRSIDPMSHIDTFEEFEDNTSVSSSSSTSMNNNLTTYDSDDDKTVWIHCELCNNSVNSEQQHMIHLMGRKHKAKEEARYGKKLHDSKPSPASIRPVGTGRKNNVNQHKASMLDRKTEQIIAWAAYQLMVAQSVGTLPTV